MSIPRLYFSSLAWPAHISWPGLTLDANCPSLLITILIKTSFSGTLKFWQLLGQSGEGQTSGRACRLSPPPSIRWHKSIQIRSTPGTQPKRAQHTRRTNKQLQQNELTTPLHLDNSEKKTCLPPRSAFVQCAFSSTGISELLQKIILQLITNI